MVWFALWMLGCNASKTNDVDRIDPVDTAITGDTGATDTDEPVDVSADAAALRQLLAGSGDAESVLAAIGARGGFPVYDVQTDSFLFVATADGRTWRVAGSFNDWNPRDMALANGLWWAEVAIDSPAGATYKLVADGVDFQLDPRARSMTYDAFGAIGFVRPPTDAPRIDRYFHLDEGRVSPRTVRVWVPHQHRASAPAPVLIAHDGQNLFDPGAIWGGWRMQEALASRDPLIVVAIDNTADRFADYTHVPDELASLGGVVGGGGDAYVGWIDDVVRPFITVRYQPSTLTGALGSSLGGLISLHQAHRGDYDFVASLSGTLGWGKFGLDNDLMVERWVSAPTTSTVVFVSSGGSAGPDGQCRDINGNGFPEDDPDDSDNYCMNRHFVDTLADNGWAWNSTLFHWHEVGAPHNEAAWASIVGLPLDVFAGLR